MGTGGTPSLQSPKDCIENYLNIDGSAYKLLQRIYSMPTVKFYGQAERAISNGQLNLLPDLHIRPIDVVVYHGPS